MSVSLAPHLVEHTPGPWSFAPQTEKGSTLAPDIFPFQIETEDWVLAEIYGDVTALQGAVAQANARLIAAAPDLLKALIWAEAAIAPFSKDPQEKSGILMVRAAIAKATGQQS